MENGSSSRSTEAFLKTLKNENLLNEDVRIPCSSTVAKYNRALKTLTEEQINEFIKNSKSAQIGFGKCEHFKRTILSKRTLKNFCLRWHHLSTKKHNRLRPEK